jgi:hypothetical protein
MLPVLAKWQWVNNRKFAESHCFAAQIFFPPPIQLTVSQQKNEEVTKARIRNDKSASRPESQFGLFLPSNAVHGGSDFGIARRDALPALQASPAAGSAFTLRAGPL